MLSAAAIASAHISAQPRPARLCALFRSAIAPLHKSHRLAVARISPVASYCLVPLSTRGGKTLISRISLYTSATCRARTGLPPMPFVGGFRICSRRRETRPQIPQAKENSHASAYSVPDPHLPPDGRAGLYTYITVRKS